MFQRVIMSIALAVAMSSVNAKAVSNTMSPEEAVRNVLQPADEQSTFHVTRHDQNHYSVLAQGTFAPQNMRGIMTAFASATGEAHDTAAVQVAKEVITQMRANLNMQDGDMRPAWTLKDGGTTSVRFNTWVNNFRLEAADVAVDVDQNGSIKLVNAELRSCNDDARAAMTSETLLTPEQVEKQVFDKLSDSAKEVVQKRLSADGKAVKVTDQIIATDTPYVRYVVRVGGATEQIDATTGKVVKTALPSREM